MELESVKEIIFTAIYLSLLPWMSLYILHSKWRHYATIGMMLMVTLLSEIQYGVFGAITISIIMILIPLIAAPIVYVVQKAVLWKVEKEHGNSGVILTMDWLAVYKQL